MCPGGIRAILVFEQTLWATADKLRGHLDAAVVLGNEALAFMARELVREVRKSVTVDWTVRQNARARIRVLVKRILRRHGYPPDLQAEATKTVLEQAEVFAGNWGQ